MQQGTHPTFCSNNKKSIREKQIMVCPFNDCYVATKNKPDLCAWTWCDVQQVFISEKLWRTMIGNTFYNNYLTRLRRWETFLTSFYTHYIV